MSDYKLLRSTGDLIYKFISSNKYASAAGLALVVVCSLLYRSKRFLSESGTSKKRRKNISKDALIDVLFFSNENAMCQDHINDGNTCSDDCGAQKLLTLVEYLDMAKESLDVCVYTITSIKLAEAVLRKFNEGVAVRVITDDSMAYGDGSQIPLFRRNGVRVRAEPSQNLMHHKFAVIDRKVLVTGSFNWTQQATFGNWENVIITSEPEEVVQRFSDQFEKLWQILD
ncbi:uncharacterized protein zuc [Planococcus citri]|uniref:uncharacterized protein zuc n=1 Tax=Planococcus citri TaxID=170843 RepID=UPI0031F8A63E